MDTLGSQVRPLLARQRPLMVMVAAMMLLACACAVGMVVDDRTLLGVSVWVKPFKFAIAFVLYGATLAWLLNLPHRGSRWTRRLALVFVVAGLADVAFIAVQAARGTFSHFNKSDDIVNSVGQTIFMYGVLGLFAANLVIAVILLRQRLADGPTTRAIKAGLWLALAGMAIAYLVGFQGEQSARDANGRMVELGAGHTVGATDDRPGMPITNWSTTGGDLRIPHFVGLHALQVLLLAAVILAALAPRVPWLRDEGARAAVMGVLAGGYTGLLALLSWQALRGQPLTEPDLLTVVGASALVAATAIGLATVRARYPARGVPLPVAV
ncbi:hypothetical protein [Rhodococcus maanshanensis]|uniref:Uncharacterized protein n=1 Tax=Rhodococcus maanshanensis TaxID=183556 RepID=A0A1H7TRP5_9NOCA|nr:hypothetical protein [Rhodococcus maanshanensis]SEL87076.1 hypothetical protein SAMN05444583_11664 [Rhodococcus maanshanensis]